MVTYFNRVVKYSGYPGGVPELQRFLLCISVDSCFTTEFLRFKAGSRLLPRTSSTPDCKAQICALQIDFKPPAEPGCDSP